MTREEYYKEFRAKRVAARESWRPINGSSITAMLKECYDFMLYGKDQIKYNLICKYEYEVSPQLKFDKKKLREKGEKNAEKMMLDLVYAESPLIKMIPKEDNLFGGYLPVPIIYGSTF